MHYRSRSSVETIATMVPVAQPLMCLVFQQQLAINKKVDCLFRPPLQLVHASMLLVYAQEMQVVQERQLNLPCQFEHKIPKVYTTMVQSQ